MALTDTALKALKPKDKPYTVSDDRRYNRAEYAEQRKEMLQFWADYVGSLGVVGDLIADRSVPTNLGEQLSNAVTKPGSIIPFDADRENLVARAGSTHAKTVRLNSTRRIN